MKRGLVLSVLALGGCSFTFMQPSTEERPPECYEQYEAPATDLAIAVIAAVVTWSGIAGPVDNAMTYGLPTSLVFVASSMYGFDKRARCEDARKHWRAWCASVGSGERPKSCDDGW